MVLLTEMALMSLVCPLKVCLQAPSLRSHSLARESQAPEMKVFMSEDRARDMQSPMWLVKTVFCLPVSRSHRQLVNKGKKRVRPGLILVMKKNNHPYILIQGCFLWANSPGRVTRRCQNLTVTNETAAGQVPCVYFMEDELNFQSHLQKWLGKEIVSVLFTGVCVQLPQGLGAGSLDIVHSANVIQPTTGHQVSRWGEGNAHHPSRF